MDQHSKRTNQVVLPSSNLPKGGGAVRSLNENVSVNAFTGSFTYSIPFVFPTARGISPSLAIFYSSGNGNGLFGCGFGFEEQSISRLTRLAIPRYDENDIFTLNENELVLKQGEDNIYLERHQENFPYIEQVDKGKASCQWKTISGDNVTSVYGNTEETRIFHPKDPGKIFKWLLSDVTDSKGNRVKYNYVKYGGTNSYLSSIQYGNYINTKGDTIFAFEIVVDYGNHQLDQIGKSGTDPYITSGNPVPRKDIFHSYKSGFHIKTEYLCRHLLVFHNFDELGIDPCLTKFMRFQYEENPIMSLLSSYEETGCIRDKNGAYSTKSNPRTDFTFTRFHPETNPTYGQLKASNSELQVDINLVDLEGEGMSGILYRKADSLIYYSPIGDGQFIQNLPPLELPAGFSNPNEKLSLKSVNGDGALQLVSDGTQGKGYYTLLDYNKWTGFHSFPSSFITDVPGYVEDADISGMGRYDKIILETDQKNYIPSLGYEGFGTPVILKDQGLTKQVFPYPGSVANTDPFTIHGFADMFGDGLSHRIKITSGEINIWPTLGYGEFDEPVVIKNTAPVFDQDIDLRTRLIFADVDGSGTTDLIVVFPGYVEIYINQSGNSFSPPVRINLPPDEFFSDSDNIQFADVTGHGTTCLVFSKLGTPIRNFFYEISATNKSGAIGHKTFLLCGVNNNLGASSSIEYATSVTEYLRDKGSANAWYTKLPFPVQVVKKMVIEDSLSSNRLTCAYKYRNGFYDPTERIFTGFGFVEHTDTSLDLEEADSNPPASTTKNWFHLGNGLKEELTRKEFFSGNPIAPKVPFAHYDFNFANADELTKKQALYALEGSELHVEISEAGNPVPYSVTASCQYLKKVQDCNPGRYGVFSTFESESCILNYEQEASDPSLAQQVILETDQYNSSLLTCSIYYPRRTQLLPEQSQFYATAERTKFKNQEDPGARWISILIEQNGYEITGLAGQFGTGYIGYKNLKSAIPSVVEHAIGYSDQPNPETICARLISCSEEIYWNADQTGILNLKNKEPVPAVLLPHHVENIEFDPQIIGDCFNSDRPIDQLRITENYIKRQGFVFKEGYWRSSSVISHFEKKDKYFLLKQVSSDWAFDGPVDPTLYTENKIEYDTCNLFVRRTAQRLNNEVSLEEITEMDYRVLMAKRIIDTNNNVSEVSFDELSRLLVSTSFGKEKGKEVGFQPLSDYDYIPPADLDAVLHDPLNYIQKAESFCYYRFAEKDDHGIWNPSVYLVLDATEFQTTDPTKIQRTISYTDGFGRVIETKQWAGKVKLLNNTETNNGYLTSGKTIYNAKGLAYKQYLSFFSDSHSYQNNFDKQVLSLLPKPTTLIYDAVDRVIQENTPKGFFSKTIHGVWEERSFDEDDTVLDSEYYREYMNTHTGGDEYDSLVQAAAFYNTPATCLRDAMGRTIIDIKDNLGRVRPELFEAIAKPGITSKAIYDNLLKHGYLALATDSFGGAWVTKAFTPYVKDFALHLDEPVAQLASSIQKILSQSRLCTWQQYDITGRSLRSADPRFFVENQVNPNPVFNFKYFYGIYNDIPLLIESVDAGNSRVFYDALNRPAQSWNALDFCTGITYDNLQRAVALHVTSPLGVNPVINQVVQRTEYGDQLHDARQDQLMGKVYKIYDSAGVLETPAYTYTGLPHCQFRTFRTHYKSEANWDTPTNEPLENEVFSFTHEYDALGRPLVETGPDKSIIAWQYGPLGNCSKSGVKLKGTGGERTIVKESVLNANKQPETVHYENGVKTLFEYDAATLELSQISTTRDSGMDCFQQLIYTHDPAGLITTIRNTKQSTVFHDNREVNPCTQYYYDAIYRLTKAAGRQLQGQYSSGSDVRNAEGIPRSLARISDLEQVEMYTEFYDYDDGDNMTRLRHISSIDPFTRTMEVGNQSNRLKKYNDFEVQYDHAGQMLKLPSGIKLEWNAAGNISTAIIIERPNGFNDCEYYVYDYAGMRVRKVHEALVTPNQYRITDKRHEGNYIVSYSGIGTNAQSMSIEKEFRTITIGGFHPHDCLLQYWEVNPNNKFVGIPNFRYQHGDVNHSVTIETNELAQVISCEEYSPFGETTYLWSAQNLEITLKEYRYSSRERDEVTALYYYGYRYYLPQLCRWTKSDPAGTVDGLNLFAFVKNNPIGSIDSNGLAAGKHEKTKKKKTSGKKANKKFSLLGNPKYEVIKNATQKDLKGKGKKGRKSFFQPGVTETDRENYVVNTKRVTGILKINGEEFITGHNTRLDPELTVPVGVGKCNQKGCKKNFHGEDLTLGSFQHHVNTDPQYKGDLKKFHKKNKFDYENNKDTKHVYSLKISASPCLGCVETLIDFKTSMEKQLGAKNFIFRVKFARLYDLRLTTTDDSKPSAIHFLQSIERLQNAGIKVRVQREESLKNMVEPEKYSDSYRGNIEGSLNELYGKNKAIADLQKTWRELKVPRKDWSMQIDQ